MDPPRPTIPVEADDQVRWVRYSRLEQALWASWGLAMAALGLGLSLVKNGGVGYFVAGAVGGFIGLWLQKRHQRPSPEIRRLPSDYAVESAARTVLRISRDSLVLGGLVLLGFLYKPLFGFGGGAALA